jgi:hypothetical protein
MQKPKILILLIIVILLLMGIYEKQTNDVVMNRVSRWGSRAGTITYITLSGNFLIYFSLVIAGIYSYLFRKD